MAINEKIQSVYKISLRDAQKICEICEKRDDDWDFWEFWEFVEMLKQQVSNFMEG